MTVPALSRGGMCGGLRERIEGVWLDGGVDLGRRAEPHKGDGLVDELEQQPERREARSIVSLGVRSGPVRSGQSVRKRGGSPAVAGCKSRHAYDVYDGVVSTVREE